MTPEPTVKELLDIAGKAVRGQVEKNADFIRGSDYEALIGPTAIVWSREARRDTDLFNAVNFNTASGDDLTDMAFKRYGKQRVLDTNGSGTAVLARPAAGVAETFWLGTRIMVPGAPAKFYRVKTQKSAAASALKVEVEIEALEPGPGVAIDVGSGVARLDDVLSDPSWYVESLKCLDGTRFERAEDFRERIRRERLDSRVGQVKAIIETCKAAGAVNGIAFRSNYAGEAYDHGLNVVYVGDLGYVGSADLVRACSLALEKTRVLGDHLQVLPMARVELDISADIYLYDAPALFDMTRIKRLHHAGIVQYLNGASGQFAFSLAGIRGAIARPTPEAQRVVLTSPAADEQIVVGALKNFPAVLNRYVPGQITLRYYGP